MATAGTAKTKLVNGQRVDISTGLPMTRSGNVKPVAPPPTYSLDAAQKPAQVTPMTPATAAAGMAGSLQQQTDTFTQRLERDAATAQAGEASSFESYITAAMSSKGANERTADAYGTKGGVDDTQEELDAVNQQLLEEQHGLRRRLEALDKNPQGLFGGALEDEKSRIETESLRRQADLAILQMGVQGRYDSAKEIADRAVAVEMERDKRKLDALQMNYERNKSLFDKSEQRKFDEAQKDRQREYEAKEYRLRAEYDQKLRQSDPLYQQQLREGNLKIQQLQQEIGTNYNLNGLTQEQFNQLPTIDKNNTTLLNIFSSDKVSAGNRTTIGAALALTRAATDLAKANPDGDFGGLYPFRGLVDFALPKAFKREETVQNESFIDALNLQTQFWASGAALTDAQTELVMNMVPTKNDTDAQVRTKVNQLVNYMMGQTASRLQTDGINFAPENINLFETNDLLLDASPEQQQELRSLGLIK